MMCSRPKAVRQITISVSTIAIPEKIAPATKYGGKIVVCQPGTTAVAKSILTMVCTDRTRGGARPANSRYTASYPSQTEYEAFQPRLSQLKMRARVRLKPDAGDFIRSRMV